MKVLDYCNVYECGWLLICEKGDMSLTDVLVAHGEKFRVEKIDFLCEGRMMGLVLSPNNIVPDYFDVGDEISKLL